MLYLLIVLGSLLISVILHELVHGLVAYKLGDDTAKKAGRLTLNPLAHIDPYMSILVPIVLFLIGGPMFGGAKPVPVDSRKLKGGEWGMALVAICGPLTNLLLAFVALFVGTLVGVFYIHDGNILYQSGNIVATVLMYFSSVNLSLAVFNLLPVAPLDGSRLLYALSPDKVREFFDKIEKYSIWVVLILIMVFNGPVMNFLAYVMDAIYVFFVNVISVVL